MSGVPFRGHDFGDLVPTYPSYGSERTAITRDSDFTSTSLPEPQYFIPPTSGIAGNGKPIFNWDQAAAQITREGASWTWSDGTPVTISYGFRSTAPASMPDDAGGFSRFSAAQILATEAALQLWADVANITFVRVGSGTTGNGAYTNNATMLFSNYSTGVAGAAAFAYYPYPGATNAADFEGDVWVNVSQSDNANPVFGEYGPHTLAHEIGHAIGLGHPGDYNADPNVDITYEQHAEYWQDSRMYTIMSYFGSSGPGGSLNAFSAGPQLHDIAAVQLLYGANMNTRTGDTIYGFNSNTNRQHYTLTADGQSPVFSIWDGGGNDTLDLSGFSTNSEIDLRELAFSSAGPGNSGVGVAVGNISIARGVVIENAIGGSGADTITGNAVANVLRGNGGNDIITGGGGNDYLDGGLGADRLDGGDGNDIIVWDASDNLANVLGGSGVDLIVFTAGAAPTTFNLTGQGFEGAEGRFTDTGGQDWTTRTDFYDALWRLDVSDVTYDNGGRARLDYDQLNAFAWATDWNRYDSLGRRDITTITNDDGTRAETFFDVADAGDWDTNWNHYNSTGGRDTNSVTNDDNSSIVLFFDPDDAFAWVTNWNRYNTLGQREANALTNDDNSSIVLYFDPTDSLDWETNWNQYDTLGRHTANAINYDNGTSVVLYFDPADAFDWTSNWNSYDNQDRLDVNALNYDNGQRALLDYDQGDLYDWATMWWLYDANDNIIGFQGVNDDGSIWT